MSQVGSVILPTIRVSCPACVECVVVIFFSRFLEVMTNRIVEIFAPEKPVSELFTQRIYRVEARDGY